MERRVANQIAEEAGAWDARLRSPDCTAADRAQFANWRQQNPAHAVEFERLQMIAAMARQEVTRADLRALRDAARTAGSARRWTIPLATAAALAVVVFGTAAWVERAGISPARPLRTLLTWVQQAGSKETGEEYVTRVGQRTVVTLRDGSTVELNAKTAMKVVFTPDQRLIQLVGGQALFHVAKNAQRPFVVRAGDREILAIGTAFDVRRDATSVRVTLIEGKVAVSRESPAEASVDSSSERVPAARHSSPSPAARLISAQPVLPTRDGTAASQHGFEVFLEPGQQLIAQESSGEAVVQPVDVQKVIGWRDGRVAFEDFTLGAAVEEMNRHSPVQIQLRSPELAALRVNGVFRAGEQEAFVTALESYFPIVAQHRGEGEIVLTAR